MFEIATIIALILSIILLGLVIFIYVRHFSYEKATDNAILEIKSKIGSIIKDINQINSMEYEVDMEQQALLNKLAATTGIIKE